MSVLIVDYNSNLYSFIVSHLYPPFLPIVKVMKHNENKNLQTNNARLILNFKGLIEGRICDGTDRCLCLCLCAARVCLLHVCVSEVNRSYCHT